MLNISSEQFNLIEGCFWVALGALILFSYFRLAQSYRRLALFASFVLITFGVSDFMQVLYGSFFQAGMEWLLLWKVLDVAGLVVVFVWYIRLRLKSQKKSFS